MEAYAGWLAARQAYAEERGRVVDAMGVLGIPGSLGSRARPVFLLELEELAGGPSALKKLPPPIAGG